LPHHSSRLSGAVSGRQAFALARCEVARFSNGELYLRLGAPVADNVCGLLGSLASAAALSEIVELAHNAALRIVVAHVQSAKSLPAFSDHLPHELRAWSEEFIARYCPGAADAALELRVGEPHEQVLDVLRESGCDLVALGWSQDLTRALVEI
jgi:nucleotide-binding universal stress UspA family protein